MKTQEEYAREIDEIVRRDVESYQSDWFKIDKEIFMLPENKNKTFILGIRKTGCDLLIDIDISTMKVGDTYSFMNNQKEMVEIKAVKRSMLGCNGCYLSNSEILCKGCNKSERETNDNIMVVRIDKMDDVYRNDRPLDSGIGVVHSFRINNKIIKAVACQTVIRNDICSKCCFVDTNICSNMRCFSSVREDDKSVIFKKIEL